MRIGEAAQATGLSVKAIRHYESVGLLPPVARRRAYRSYAESDVEALRAIARCRELGFSIAETREVLSLVASARPACPPAARMDALVERRLRTVQREIERLQGVAAQLARTRKYLASRGRDGARAG